MSAGTRSAGPYELRLPIFLQPLGGVLKNRSAAPASPPCFRRRRRSAPLLFESTRPVSLALQQNKNLSVLSYVEVFWWARVDYASRASKKAPQGLFSPPDCSAGRCCSNPPAFVSLTHKQNKKLQRNKYARAFLVERSNPNPNHCPLGHLWRRFHRK